MRNQLHSWCAIGAIAWICIIPGLYAQAEILAFPGAEGFGAQAKGGRGGRVLEVTNLEDSGLGSFRHAVEAEGPRTVVFRIGGTISLLSEVVIEHPYLTIAGQTAPGGGITLKTHASNSRSALTIARGCHDVIIRYLRSRPGPHTGFPKKREGAPVDTSEVKDALQILGAHRVILDHCSASWATDEVVSTYFDVKDVTIQWSIIAEALVKSRADQQLPGKGLLLGSKGGTRISVHHNLFVHNIGRNPLVKCAGVVDVVNNIAFVPDKVAMAIDAEHGKGIANFVSNQVSAPAADGLAAGLAVVGRGEFSIFVKDNLGPMRLRDDQPDEYFINDTNHGRQRMISTRHEAPSITTYPAIELTERVLPAVGCCIPIRDDVDQRIIEDVRLGRTRIVHDPEDVGGWPVLEIGDAPSDTDHDGMSDDWEERQGLDSTNPQDGREDRNSDGYTNLEEYLNSLAG